MEIYATDCYCSGKLEAYLHAKGIAYRLRPIGSSRPASGSLTAPGKCPPKCGKSEAFDYAYVHERRFPEH